MTNPKVVYLILNLHNNQRENICGFVDVWAMGRIGTSGRQAGAKDIFGTGTRKQPPYKNNIFLRGYILQKEYNIIVKLN